MLILLDECVPEPLRGYISGHEVRTIRAAGWSGKKNGELLNLMTAAGVHVFLTVDQNLGYQQNLTNLSIAIIVMKAITNRLNDLLPLVPAVENALDTIQEGQLVVISE
ncbi:MAG: hypothetical protein QM811_02175 [Pirellulales bacterium]